MKHVINTKWLANADQAVATFLMILEAHVNICFIIKVVILVFIKKSFRFPQLCRLLNLKWLPYCILNMSSNLFQLHHVFLVSIFGTTSNHIPLTY